MFRKIAWLCAGSLFALAMMNGCVIDGSESGANAAIETQSEASLSYDTDATREGALGLIFGMPQIDDRLDFNNGDKEDWRYIVVAENGVMSITLNLDSPQSIQGGWNIYDSEERALLRQSFVQGQGFYEFPNFPVKPGVYYFQTFATSGHSIYTLATSFSPRQVEERVVEQIVESDPEPDDPTPKPKPKPKPTPSPSPSPTPAPQKTGQTIMGSISVITPQDDGTAEIKITGIGRDKGIETGAVGVIEGTNVKVTMSSCLNKSCKAILPASVNYKSFKHGAHVIFTL